MSEENKHLKEEVTNWKRIHVEREKKITAKLKQMEKLEGEVRKQTKELTNRGLRKTLTIKEVNEDVENETWEQTADIVTQLIQQHLPTGTARDMIDVAHRGGKRGEEGKYLLHSKQEQNAQTVLTGFTKINKENKDMKIKLLLLSLLLLS